jgi:predicted  nucleic acid-binding Zn-ribbon protein
VTADPGPAAGRPPSADPLGSLLRVQDLDTELAQLEHRRSSLPERADLRAATARLHALDTEMAALDAERQLLADRQQEIERQVSTVMSRRSTIEQRMYAARGPDVRDLQAMADEVAHLDHRRSELEDQELEVMEQQEPLEGALARLAGDRDALEAATVSLTTALHAAEAVIDAEIATVAASRAIEADGLPASLRERYETLRAKLGGVGAARLVGSRCSGCHLELPSMEVDRIRHLPPGTVATCDQCGRLLVRAPAP